MSTQIHGPLHRYSDLERERNVAWQQMGLDGLQLTRNRHQIDQLKDERTKLREKLEKARDDLEAMKIRHALEIRAMQERIAVLERRLEELEPD